MSYVRFSPKQRRAISWWLPGGPDAGFEALVCDGAVRSGKTLAMGLGFFLWAGSGFQGRRFALCGKTIGALRRNVLAELVPRLKELGAELTERRSENKLTVRFGGRSNDFYLFGGRDEAAAGMIQGMTLAGVLMDEVALMPRSFVEQACARCSVTGSRLWFNCNPAGPNHWFYREWILGAKERNALHLHFTMEDNPSLSPEIRQRYERLYTGIFYRRFVLGQWAQAEGRVYDFFEPEMVAQVPQGSFESWYISCDYGTVNPMSMGLWGLQKGVWYRVEEFYFDSRAKKRQMTDGEYERALQALAAGRPIREVIVDPSAASFLQLLRQKGWHVRKANNDVLSGIRATADALKAGRIRICAPCRDCLRELEEYVWDLRSGQRDQVKKEHDHAMDDMRYFVSTVLTGPQTGFSVGSVARRR
ncbi:MAG: PBSX family phage terminase large subunit [Oscillospiraceae bacterium]|nr:PBSX family phage terminase large subunit [Oscillospiraceae bacterium]